MTKYKRLFLLNFFLCHAILWTSRIILPMFYNYVCDEVIPRLTLCIIMSAVYITYFSALKEILLTFRINSQLSMLKMEEDFQRQQDKKLDTIQKNSQALQSQFFIRLNTISSLLHQGNLSQSSLELQNLTDYFEKIRVRSICSDSLLNTILQDRKEIAEENYIKVNYQILLPEQLNLPNTVLSSIFFNLLDNGIESCINSSVNEPFLTLTVQYKANFLHINMENSKSADIVFDRKTTKSDSALHGYGLAIIEELADKYNGFCEWIDKGNTFQSLIMLHTDISCYENERQH